MKNLLLLLALLLTLGSCTNNQYFELAPDIYILDKEDPIESFEELTESLKGKPIYIDRWATWCSPCIAEFERSKVLHDFLKANKIEIVYLNSDNDIEEDEWFDFIVDHNLLGYHVRLDSVLKADLIEMEIFIPRIPQYMIVGRDGTIITNDALRPSSGEELNNQLKEVLNL